MVFHRFSCVQMMLLNFWEFMIDYIHHPYDWCVQHENRICWGYVRMWCSKQNSNKTHFSFQLQDKQWLQLIWTGWSSVTTTHSCWKNVTSRNHSARYVQWNVTNVVFDMPTFLHDDYPFITKISDRIVITSLFATLRHSPMNWHSLSQMFERFFLLKSLFVYCFRNQATSQTWAHSVTVEWCKIRPLALFQLPTRRVLPLSWRPRRMKWVHFSYRWHLFSSTAFHMMSIFTESSMMTIFITHVFLIYYSIASNSFLNCHIICNLNRIFPFFSRSILEQASKEHLQSHIWPRFTPLIEEVAKHTRQQPLP